MHLCVLPQLSKGPPKSTTTGEKMLLDKYSPHNLWLQTFYQFLRNIYM